MKKSANGYYKFYSKDGTGCRIKCDKDIKGKVIIKFKKVNALTWNWFAPKNNFKNSLDALAYILKNLENKKMVFKIMNTEKDLHEHAQV